MTGFSKKSLGHRRFAGFARLLCLVTVSIFAMASWGPTPVEASYYYKQPSVPASVKYFEQRLGQLYYTLSARISLLESQLNGQMGVVDFSLCPGFKEENTAVITTCVTNPSAGAGATTTDVNITFTTPYSSPPVVGVAYSGLSFLNSKNCTLEVIDVQTNQFTIRQFADDFLPIETRATYFACP
ncbi:hypothetical protein ACOMHN_061530 [Nucella lapillus]